MDRRPHPIREFAAAVVMLTVIPLGHTEGIPAASVAYYPWVGWIVGLSGAAVGVSLVESGGAARAPLVTAACIVALWALLTRFLHLDGLADTADGMLGGTDSASRLAIMRDSHIGAFGATALVMALVTEVVATGSLLGRLAFWPLAAAPVVGRAMASVAAWALPPARDEGLGRAVAGRPDGYAIVAWALGLGLVFAPVLWTRPEAGSLMLPVYGSLAAGMVVGLAFPRLAARSLGGITGDVLGATMVVVEVTVLVVASLLA